MNQAASNWIESHREDGITFRDPQTAFENAIAKNAFTKRDAHNFMYMGTRGGKDMFKHRITRAYTNV